MTANLPDQGPRRHHRRRRFRLLGRLSSGQARLDRHRAARAQAADLRHDLARRRPDRPVARLAEHDAAREIFGRPLRQARSRDRRRHRHAPGRLDHRGADRGAQARDLPAGVARPRLRRRRARDFARRSQGDVSASQHRRTWSAPCICRSTASATRPTSPWRWPRARASAAPRSSKASRSPRSTRRTAASPASPGRKDGEQGTIEADIVVNCAGMWARELGAHERRHHPAARLRAFLSRHRADPRPDAACRCCACRTNAPTTRRTPAR